MLARTAMLIKLSTSHNSISASFALFSPYGAGFDKAKRATFAAIAACAAMARISLEQGLQRAQCQNA